MRQFQGHPSDCLNGGQIGSRQITPPSSRRRRRYLAKLARLGRLHNHNGPQTGTTPVGQAKPTADGKAGEA
jgi:hypothetical protein